MLSYKQMTVERLICTCDRCKKPIDPETEEIEWQERFIISFRAGYGSVFGDGNLVEGDFCQDCIKSVLGKWLRIKTEEDLDARHKPVSAPEKIKQPYQYKEMEAERHVSSDFSTIYKAAVETETKKLKKRGRTNTAQVI